MPTLKVESYGVRVFHTGQRVIWIRTENLPGRSIWWGVVVRFLESTDMPAVGNTLKDEDSYLVAYLPIEQYRDLYHILQTENPVYLTWTLRSSNSEFYLSTNLEPSGEGFSDRSG
jgi:hypothetical protein